MESFPPTPVTNYGIQLLKEGIEPHITYVSPDGDMVFYLNGGLAPFPGVTEGVILADGMDGLHPSFSHLDHKGARQDGVTWADTVYDPAEINMEVICSARTPEGLRKIIRQWMAAWDPQKRGTLSWVTPEGGEWWCHPRLNRPPLDKMAKTMARSKEQTFKWSIRNDDAFWRTHDSISSFQHVFNSAYDDFNRDDYANLGPNWAQLYSGAGGGTCETEDGFFGDDRAGRARWVEYGTTGRKVVNRWLGKDEVQTVTVVGTPSKIVLTYGGQSTAPITHPASAVTVQAGLQALSSIGPANCTVTGPAGGPYQVNFINTLGKRNLDDIKGTTTGGGYIAVETTTDGSMSVTATDNQIVEIQIAELFEFPFPDAGYVDIWARMDAAMTT